MSRIKSDLKTHLIMPGKQRNYAWKDQLYQRIPLYDYNVIGSMTGPNERPYAAVTINDKQNQNKSKVKTFSKLIEYCMERLGGIAIVLDEKELQPDAVLDFGSVWSCHEYGELAGCNNVIQDYKKAYELDPNNPFDAVVSESEKFSLGEPSDAFFPPYVRELISEEIKTLLPNADPFIFSFGSRKICDVVEHSGFA